MADQKQQPTAPLQDAAMDQVRLLLAIAGTGLIGYGAWLHYPPAGFIAAGTLLVSVAVVGALRAR